MKKLLLGLFVVVLAVAAAGGGWLFWQKTSLESFASTPAAPMSESVVTVRPGMGPQSVSKALEQAGAVSSAERFYQYVRFVRRVGGQFKAGDYAFRPDAPQTPDQVIDRLLKGEILSVKVTIPEGLRIEEQAPLFAAAGLVDPTEYVRLARDPSFTRSLGIEADSLEGYLFPDTYLLPKNSTAESVLRLMVGRFEKAWSAAEQARLPDVSLSRHQAVTLASIVEKETGAPEERPRISCVFHNRLRRNMKLQTDPTVIYSVLLSTGTFDGNLRRIHLDTPHPYNTYSVRGLPPGPIANAGEAALKAALAPITCEDLFFVSRNDGTHVFCPTLACHEENVEKWQRQFFRKKRAAQRAAARQGTSDAQ